MEANLYPRAAADSAIVVDGTMAREEWGYDACAASSEMKSGLAPFGRSDANDAYSSD
jgi:hypothetical protein